jgi:integrase
VELLDAVVPGLGLRVTDLGVKTFFFRSRFPGASARNHPTRRALGVYGALTLEQARQKARGWIELLQQGIDPGEAETRERHAAQRRLANNFSAVAEAFIAHCRRKGQRKARAVEREVRAEFMTPWGSRPITEITSHDVVTVIDAVVARGAEYQAHNLLGHIRRLFNWAIGRGVYGLQHSPCDRLRPRDLIGRRAMRTRVLTDAELRAFWRAAGAMRYPWGLFFQLLFVTMQRRGEVAGARRREIDLAHALWTIPAARMKMDAAHVVPLPPLAMRLFASIPSFPKGDLLFSTTFGAKPIAGFGKAKRELDGLMLSELRKAAAERGDDPEKIKLEQWGLHDIRRTGRTALSALPVPEIARELVIAHAKRGMHRVYDQHTYLVEKRQALEMWETRLEQVVGAPE